MTNRTKLVGLALGLWLALEILALALVLRAVGLIAALLLGLGATALGLADVKRVLALWRDRGKARADGAMLDGVLLALASLLLILPGFASDLAGLALKSPSIRASIASWMRDRGKAAAADSRLIDLDPREWRHLTPSGRPRRKRKKAVPHSASTNTRP